MAVQDIQELLISWMASRTERESDLIGSNWMRGTKMAGLEDSIFFALIPLFWAALSFFGRTHIILFYMLCVVICFLGT